MKKLDVSKTNQSSSDIWQLIKISVQNKNWATLIQNLNRLNALQRYYCQLLSNQEAELKVLRYEEKYLTQRLAEYEKNELIELMKINGNYQTFKSRIDELFKEE